MKIVFYFVIPISLDLASIPYPDSALGLKYFTISTYKQAYRFKCSNDEANLTIPIDFRVDTFNITYTRCNQGTWDSKAVDNLLFIATLH